MGHKSTTSQVALLFVQSAYVKSERVYVCVDRVYFYVCVCVDMYVRLTLCASTRGQPENSLRLLLHNKKHTGLFLDEGLNRGPCSIGHNMETVEAPPPAYACPIVSDAARVEQASSDGTPGGDAVGYTDSAILVGAPTTHLAIRRHTA
jgi:hypothetical protein